MRRLFLALLLTLSLSPAHATIFGSPFDVLYLLKDYETRRESSSDPNWQDGNADARPISPGETLTIADIEGPGKIVHIWCTVNAQDRFYSRLLVVRMYWDGEENPSVEVPLGDFFAAGHGMDVPVDSFPVRVTSDGRARNCYWPMPFRKSARITITNEGPGHVNAFYYYVDWQKHKSLPEDTAYFHAMYHQEFPTTADGKNYLILDAVGRGHYVGTVQSVRLNEPGWYGEGDDFFFIDGEAEPSIRGTGTEDYFCDAWGFRKLDGLFYGLPIFEGYGTGDRLTAYRWHIPDPVTFTKSLWLEIEHKGSRDNVSGFIERYDDFSTVAYWYQTEPHKPFPALPAAKDRLLDDPAHIVEMENFLDKTTVQGASEDAIKIQHGVGFGAGQLFFTPLSPNASFTVQMPECSAGRYEVVLHATQSFDYGIYRALLNGQPLGGPVDYYYNGTGARTVRTGAVKLESGPMTLEFRNVGKSSASAGYYFGIDAIQIRPLPAIP